jgi:hypothetical protein
MLSDKYNLMQFIQEDTKQNSSNWFSSRLIPKEIEHWVKEAFIKIADLTLENKEIAPAFPLAPSLYKLYF